MFEIIFYHTESGNCPVDNFLDSLSTDMLSRMDHEIDLLKTVGNQIKYPDSKPVEDGIFELRAESKDGITRIMYFFVIGKKAVLTNGFVKKTEKTPRREIELAKKYRNDYFAQQEKKRRQ